jgi:hypothetical protein
VARLPIAPSRRQFFFAGNNRGKRGGFLLEAIVFLWDVFSGCPEKIAA